MFKLHIFAIVFFCFGLSLASNDLSVQLIAAYFNQVLSSGSEVWLPNETNYTSSITQRWTVFPPAEPTYIIALKPALTSDIQKIIHFASYYNIPFMATGGGHGYSSTLHGCKNGIDIDLGFFHDIKIDNEASTITIGGSVKFGKIIKPLYDAGKEIQTGTGGCVGVVGATLGAGVGPYTGLHGLVIDALLEVKYVTGAGDFVTASKTINPELFWGARGAGHQFGVVYEATYMTHEATNNGNLILADLRFPASDNGSLWEILKDIGTNQPKEMSLALQANWDDRYGGLNILVTVEWIGPMQEALIKLAPFLSLQPIQQNITQIPWFELYDHPSAGDSNAICEAGTNTSIWAANLYTIDIPTFLQTFQNLANFYSEFPDSRSSIWDIEKFANSITLSTPDDETAYPHRNTTIYTLLDLQINDKSHTDQINAFGASFRSRLAASSGYDELRVYVNYGRDEGEAVWYSERKLARLKALKRRYDPQELFSHYNPVRISGEQHVTITEIDGWMSGIGGEYE
ncbi:hypothetical protein DSL72_008902 [Monilinia vaccinii-corymbosi]|uniref:FAD-binding PCMH-type domain-containing protein n=1 Tax=Monilinia vaccinii-corymbosi TaxID=61207 RepID=A0A8A3PQH8_9HELO|nr:hypothetical protein DSL72_008902 [Monilinia vaccinii-corymbosi]